MTAHANVRWSRTEESADFFIDEDRLRALFHVLASACLALLALLAAGLWELQRAALAPPRFYGISHGLVFSGPPDGVSSVRNSDFDRQLSDTVEVLFSRTEKGLPPGIADFCSKEVVKEVDRAYQEAAKRYPAGYVQTLVLLESKTVAGRPGYRRVYYRGLLSSRSVSAAQTSPVYLDCSFSVGAPNPRNAAGWRLMRADALGREDFYRDEREREVRSALDLPPKAPALPAGADRSK